MNEKVESRLRDAGLEVLGMFEGQIGPTVTEVFRNVVHLDAEPVERIHRGEADASRVVDQRWKARAIAGGIVAGDGSFLAAAGMELGWVQVRLTERTSVSATEDQPGELLFIARSLRGDRALAVSAEGSEYWLLEAEFPEAA
ncbi:hypothetical protein DMH12_18130 [Streptomyces sp. WAC 04229]|uniref:hypothetical protein n=1 Tax=Streptomyces sp. WAC 04229 TaxID=2203206 RepID=UPI000F7431BB|nr:hypothetical protein [Streptomyces sp. WAC 04229]RSN53271.1 hypothetical protein DMH12_18130 [Streptomyces sp. WAC 04229]